MPRRIRIDHFSHPCEDLLQPREVVVWMIWSWFEKSSSIFSGSPLRISLFLFFSWSTLFLVTFPLFASVILLICYRCFETHAQITHAPENVEHVSCSHLVNPKNTKEKWRKKDVASHTHTYNCYEKKEPNTKTIIKCQNICACLLYSELGLKISKTNKTKTSKVLILYLGKKNACFFFGKSFFKKYTHLSRNHVFLMLAVENNEIG